MLKRISCGIAAVIIFLSPCKAYSAKSYALVEMNTGRMLTGSQVNYRLPMASTTKIMTGLLACESGKMDQVFTVSDEAVRVEGSSMGLHAGEKITLRDLTYGLLLESGNDAANTIACCLDGSLCEFANRMNRRAAELELNSTHFVTPSGLDNKEHYTTALDLARLGAVAMKNREFARIASTVRYRIANGRMLYNHNEMLQTYNGAIGIKTGYTKKSGRCLVTCAERDGITIVAATLNGMDDWGDHKALLDYGFRVLKKRGLFTEHPDIKIKVTGGVADSVLCTYDDTLTAGLKDDEISRVKMQIKTPDSVKAPVRRGQKLGEITFTLDGKIIAKTDVTAGGTAAMQEKPKTFRHFWDFFMKR